MDSFLGVFRWMKLKPEGTQPRKRGQTLSTSHLVRVFIFILAMLTTSFSSLAQTTPSHVRPMRFTPPKWPPPSPTPGTSTQYVPRFNVCRLRPIETWTRTPFLWWFT